MGQGCGHLGAVLDVFAWKPITLLLLGCDSVAYECEKLVLLQPCPVTHVALDPHRRPDRAAACNL